MDSYWFPFPFRVSFLTVTFDQKLDKVRELHLILLGSLGDFSTSDQGNQGDCENGTASEYKTV